MACTVHVMLNMFDVILGLYVIDNHEVLIAFKFPLTIVNPTF